MATIKWEAGSIQSLLTTELNSLAAAARSNAGTEYDNSASGNLYTHAAFQLTVDFVTAPTANGLVELYLIPALDGTNYADGSSSLAPGNANYVGAFTVQNTTAAQTVSMFAGGVRGLLQIPPLKLKLIVLNSTSQAFPATGSIVKMTPWRMQTA